MAGKGQNLRFPPGSDSKPRVFKPWTPDRVPKRQLDISEMFFKRKLIFIIILETKMRSTYSKVVYMKCYQTGENAHTRLCHPSNYEGGSTTGG